MLVRLGEHENVENLDKAHIRQTLLGLAEQGLRGSLKQLQANYEISDLRNKLQIEEKKQVGADDEAM